MKLVYTNENSALVSSAKNLVENAGISVALKNEHSGGYPGLLGAFSTWPELWILDDGDYIQRQCS